MRRRSQQYCRCAKKWRVQALQRVQTGSFLRLVGPDIDRRGLSSSWRNDHTVNIRLYGTLVHFVAHLLFQEIYSLTTATSCRLLVRTNEMRSFRTIVRCCSLVRPQRSRSSQLYGRVPYNWDAYNRILTVSYKRKLPLRAVFVSLQHTYTPNSADPSRICSKLFTR